ncbi:hypothetical protein DSUL_100141 [Desulfovibrionales bacterium]
MTYYRPWNISIYNYLGHELYIFLALSALVISSSFIYAYFIYF